MTSMLFPGQGSQFVGMSKDFYDNFNSSKIIIDEIENITSLPIKDIIFKDKFNQLNLTQYTQICIFAASISIYKALEETSKLNINQMLGHSLGEYTALAASNKISIKDASILLKTRGELMNSAIKPNTSGMAALIGLECSNIEKIINDHNLKLYIANDNSTTQIVISGMIDDINKSKDIFLNNGVKKFVILNVSAAFHSPIMLEAQKNMKNIIEKIEFKNNDTLIVSNYNAKLSNKNIDLKKNLSKQIANRVRWVESINTLEETKDYNIIEIGPGKVHSGLIKRMNNNFSINSINSVNDLKNLNL